MLRVRVPQNGVVSLGEHRSGGKPRTLFEKVWDRHVVAHLGDGVDLLFVDRHLTHDLEAGPNLARLARHGRAVRRPDLTFATPDHAVASDAARTEDTNPTGGRLLRDMRRLGAQAGIRVFDLDEVGQGIVHVIGPELGLTLPGSLIVCSDSHTCTHGGLGALAFGVGASEATHVLATQTIRQMRPATMRVTFVGDRPLGTTAKDMVLHAIGTLGVAAGRGHAVEWAGDAVRALEIHERLTLCNMTIEMGSKTGMIAPDDRAFEYVAGRLYAPRGEALERAIAEWQTLRSDDDAAFDTEHTVDLAGLVPQVTWGTNPEQVVGIDAVVPDPEREADPTRRAAMRAALEYMGLRPGERLEGLRVQHVFIGSCANSRLPDLREAAAVVRGRRVADGVRAWVVPGSVEVRRAAEAEGLDRVFRDAGFEWRQPSCSMCLAANGDIVPPGERCVSTTNRNFVGRQGPGARTHLASPAMAAAAAVTGMLTDVRALGVSQ